MRTFTYKGFGRIYTETEEDVTRICNHLKEADPHEYNYYYPANLITTIDKYPAVEYIGKFELDLDALELWCQFNEIPLLIFDAKEDEYPAGMTILLDKEAARDKMLA